MRLLSKIKRKSENNRKSNTEIKGCGTLYEKEANVCTYESIFLEAPLPSPPNHIYLRMHPAMTFKLWAQGLDLNYIFRRESVTR